MNSLGNQNLDNAEYNELMGFCNKTHFPNLQETSTLIQTHATDAIHMASSDTSIQVVFSGFDETCSVGRGFGLPGSDLDTRCIVIKGTETEKKAFYDCLMHYLDPEIIDKQAASKNMIVLYDDIVSYGNRYYLHEERTLSETLDAARALSILHSGKLLINNASLEESTILSSLRLYKKERNGYIQSHLHFKDRALKPKLLKRITLQRTFPTLSAHEQYIITKIMRSFCHNIPFDFKMDAKNPHINILTELFIKKLLNYDEQRSIFVANWLPTGMYDTSTEINFNASIFDNLIS